MPRKKFENIDRFLKEDKIATTKLQQQNRNNKTASVNESFVLCKLDNYKTIKEQNSSFFY